MKRLTLALMLVLGLAPFAWAEPTPTNSTLSWDYTSASDTAGFYIYAAPQAESPRVYDDTRRFQIADPAARTAIVLDVAGPTSGGWCFQMTAYDMAGQESSFSEEACGFFGFSPPGNLTVQ